MPDAESFLVKHYVEKHLESVLPLLQAHPIYSPQVCLRTIALAKPGSIEGTYQRA